MMFKFIIRTAMIALLLCAYENTFAETQPARTYDVQVLVFSHLTANQLQTEQWPLLSSDVINAFHQNTQPAQPTNAASQLQREKNALTKNPGYAVLFDGSFQRAWVGDTSTVTLPISNGTELNGTITIELDHYFNVQTKLLLTEPLSLLQKIDTSDYFKQWNQSTFSFQFSENRRMRSDELNYLGHPLLGVLIKIIPVKN